MSIVSGITLHVGVLDDHEDNAPVWNKINEFLASKDVRPLVRVDDHYGGSKHPQCAVYGAGYNYFSSVEDEFAAFIISLEWGDPENVVLIIQPENGPTKVYRPSH